MGKTLKDNLRIIVEISMVVVILIGMAVGYGVNKNQTEVNRLADIKTNKRVDDMYGKIETILIKQGTILNQIETLKTQNSLILKHVVK